MIYYQNYFMAKLFKNVIVLDSGARGATTTFVENGQGDVLIAWIWILHFCNCNGLLHSIILLYFYQ